MLQSKEKIGRLDREITFIQSVIEQGESNEDKITDWEVITNYPTVSARKIEQGGNTLVVNDRVTYSAQTNWIIRYRNDLNVRMRLVWDTKVFEIVHIAEMKETRGRYMDVITTLLDNIYFT